MRKKSIFIIGTKTLADLILDLAERCDVRVDGFFDDTTKDKVYRGKPIFGDTYLIFSNSIEFKNSSFIVAIGDNTGRLKMCSKLLKSDLNLSTLIDPQATIMPTSVIEPGTLIFAHAYIGTNTSIGHGNIILPNVVITHHSTIGDYNFFAPGVTLGGYTTTGMCVKLGMNSVVAPKSIIQDNYTCPPLTYVINK